MAEPQHQPDLKPADSPAPLPEMRFEGIGVSPGVAKGLTFLYGKPEENVGKRSITDKDIDLEINRFENALVQTRQQVIDIQKQIAQAIGNADASIFEAHLLVTEDSTLIEGVINILRTEKVNVEFALVQFAQVYIGIFEKREEEYLRERAADIRDVTNRILRNLQGKEHFDLRQLQEPRIVISYDLAPSDTAVMDRKKVLGFCTDIGSRTSHTAIMARSLDIPAVVGLHNASTQIAPNQVALVDGYEGLLIINPTEQTLFEYGQLEVKRHDIEIQLDKLHDLPAVTTDGGHIALHVNIEGPDDIPAVLKCGAEGVGLFRTEYIFMNRSNLPSEEEQYKAYVEVAQKLFPRPVIIRTLDLGGDKFLSHFEVPQEMNPFLGWRAIRFCLERTDIFLTQLRAILRASEVGNVKMMYPLISSKQEFCQANEILQIARQELEEQKKGFNASMEVGAMIEVPSAAITANHIAEEADFFSIGTNDLIQYALAVDRVNEKIAYLYDPAHPAILRLISEIIQAGHNHGIEVGLCGEMGGDVTLTPLLIGMGIDEISMNASAIPVVKKMIRSIGRQECENFAREMLKLCSGEQIWEHSRQVVLAKAPELLELG